LQPIFPSGAELRRVRESRGLATGEVADATGLDRTTIWRVENERPASPRVRRLFAVALGLPVIPQPKKQR
jgi:transcriptional regulator with XRE-family HTH domain